jgi:hypothetical protein
MRPYRAFVTLRRSIYSARHDDGKWPYATARDRKNDPETLESSSPAMLMGFLDRAPVR